MRIEIFIRYFLDFASLYPAAAMCFAPIIRMLEKPFTAAVSAFAAISAVSAASALICTVFSLDSNLLLIPAAVLFFVLLRFLGGFVWCIDYGAMDTDLHAGVRSYFSPRRCLCRCA